MSSYDQCLELNTYLDLYLRCYEGYKGYEKTVSRYFKFLG